MLTKKVQWIAEELGLDGDDVLDMLLGNIKKPREDVEAVQSAAIRYDNERERNLGDQPFMGRFSDY